MQRVHAVDVKVACAPGGGVAALLGVPADLHSGDSTQKVIPVAQIERRLLDGLQPHDGAYRGVIRRQQAGVCLHLNGLLCRPYLQVKVLTRLLTHAEHNIFLHS